MMKKKKISSYPNFLLNLLMDQSNPNYKNFQKNINSYNNAVFFFSSIVVKVVDFNGRGPIKMQTCHSDKAIF